MTITYASVCDGIGAAHVAWQPLGMRCAWTSEIERFPIETVEQRWGFTNLGDMTKINTGEAINEHGRINLLVGGTPCQSFSVAGLRKGLDDPRGNLALVFLRLLDDLRPEWVVWENVPGVLSSSEGRDFGSFLGGLEELGYGWAYRVLDAQYVRVESHPYAVPQRRRRVFVVGYLGDWRRAAAVLFEREGMFGHPPPSRQSRKTIAADVAPCLVSSGRGVERSGDTRGQDPVVAVVARSLTARMDGSPCVDRGPEMIVQPFPVANCMTRRMHKGINSTVDEGQTPVIGIRKSKRAQVVDGDESWVDDGVSNTLNGFDVGDVRSTSLAVDMSARRLTPRECERLQGFPDDYTLIQYRGKPATDSPRYKGLGNTMSVNVMSYIGQRIILANSINTQRKETQ